MTNAEQIKEQKNYWSTILGEATKEQVLDLANRMNLSTHHENGKQRALNQIKTTIAYNKDSQFREGLRKLNNK